MVVGEGVISACHFSETRVFDLFSPNISTKNSLLWTQVRGIWLGGRMDSMPKIELWPICLLAILIPTLPRYVLLTSRPKKLLYGFRGHLGVLKAVILFEHVHMYTCTHWNSADVRGFFFRWRSLFFLVVRDRRKLRSACSPEGAAHSVCRADCTMTVTRW